MSSRSPFLLPYHSPLLLLPPPKKGCCSRSNTKTLIQIWVYWQLLRL